MTKRLSNDRRLAQKFATDFYGAAVSAVGARAHPRYGSKGLRDVARPDAAFDSGVIRAADVEFCRDLFLC